MRKQKNIALVAHDGKKLELINWAKSHKSKLTQHVLFATGSTGGLLETHLDLSVHKLESGPLGGDLQLGAKIVAGEIDLLIFFWDPLESQPHDPDVRALLRITTVWNIPIACTQITADIIMGSSFIDNQFERTIPDYSQYRQRNI